MTIQCCNCKSVLAQGEWMRPPVAAEGAISHSYCPICLEAARRDLLVQRRPKSMPMPEDLDVVVFG